MKNIIIVGGGSAGWMTAASLIKRFPEKNITLIESPNIGTIGVGESTLGHINSWLNFLEIEDKDFMPHCEGSYNLQIFIKKAQVLFITHLVDHFIWTLKNETNGISENNY